MKWNFEPLAGPYQGPIGGLAWDGSAMLFSAIDEERIFRFDPRTRSSDEFRRYTNRTNGIAFAPDGMLYGCQEGGRRIIQFASDGSARTTVNRLAGQIHNHPTDLSIDGAGRIWFTDPYSRRPAVGPQIFPQLEHASVLRLERDIARNWTIKRVTHDTRAPRAVLLSADEKILYVAEGDVDGDAPRELRAYPIRDDGAVEPFTVLHTFGRDYRGAHRGIEGMCLDSNGNIVACAGWRRSGPGPMIYQFSPSGEVLQTQPLPYDVPSKCAFGDPGLTSLYVTTLEGHVCRAASPSLKGHPARVPST